MNLPLERLHIAARAREFNLGINSTQYLQKLSQSRTCNSPKSSVKILRTLSLECALRPRLFRFSSDLFPAVGARSRSKI